jgi:hypothetical protein
MPRPAPSSVAGFSVVRGLFLVVGSLMMLAGFAVLYVGTVVGIYPGLWLVGSGGVLIIVAVLERSRYRSQAAEQASEPPGPGGGETGGAVEPRFRPTDEVFVDPTTQRRMRVLYDPRTGERRYVAEA